jgi:hypothetical protein
MRDIHSQFEVAESRVYEAYPLTPPEPALHEKTLQLHARMLDAGRPLQAEKKSAIWVVHGMGQQVPFATLEQVAEGIIQTIGDANVVNLLYREVKVDNTILQRVELTLEKHGTQRQVDIYECYWAPKTEGMVKLRNVIDFLWDGGTRGFINSFSWFQRALFTEMVAFKIHLRTPAYLLATLSVLGALMVINAIILATGASIAGLGDLPERSLVSPLTVVSGLASAAAITFGAILVIAEATKPLRSKSVWGHAVRNITWFGVVFTILDLVVSAALMGIIFWRKWNPTWLQGGAPYLQTLANAVIFASLILALTSRLHRRWKLSRPKSAAAAQKTNSRSGWFGPTLFYLAFLLHLAVALGTLAILFSAQGGDFATSLVGVKILGVRGGILSIFSALHFECVFHVMARFLRWRGWVWPFLAIVSAQVRLLMVEYVGDVAAYVASNKVDCFDELRAKIKQMAKASLSAVYGAKSHNSEGFEYEKVCVVGHSLGSVIAYDTLNRAIADDQLATQRDPKTGQKFEDGPAQIVKRTPVLLTFGSPLDKTAFFFSIMGKTTRHIREQLAAVVQPLIENDRIRERIRWVNVFSPSDIVSGSLDFYELPRWKHDPAQKTKCIQNEIDEDALVPLVAHVDYWANKKVWTELLKFVW